MTPTAERALTALHVMRSERGHLLTINVVRNALIREAHREGAGATAIAEALGVARSTVYNVLGKGKA